MASTSVRKVKYTIYNTNEDGYLWGFLKGVTLDYAIFGAAVESAHLYDSYDEPMNLIESIRNGMSFMVVVVEV